jgi:hypothetical protein
MSLARIGIFAAFVSVSSIALVFTSAPHAASTSNSGSAIYVANAGYVTVYPLGSNGDVAPVSTIDGAATKLSDADGIALDSKGTIYVLNDYAANALSAAGGSVVIFSAGSKGNVSPIGTIAGPQTLLRSVKSIAVDSAGNIYVAAGEPYPTGVRVFSKGSTGDLRPRANIAPRADIGHPDTGFENPDGLTVDPSGRIVVANGNGLLDRSGVFFFPFGADGDMRPTRAIRGDRAGMNWPVGVALDSQYKVYVANNGNPPSIRVYSPDSEENVSPIATISGTATGLVGRALRGIALDSEGNIYVVSDGHDTTESNITVFRAGSNGNIKPMAVIAGDNTGLSSAAGIAIGPYVSH